MELKCPKCGSNRINQYRIPTGEIWCEDCKFKVNHKEINNPFMNNKMGQETKYHYGREIIYQLRVCHAINSEVYLHWLDKINEEERNEITKVDS